MATENVEFDLSVFDRIASEIVNAFSLIIEQTKKRRDQLLTQLNELRIQFHEKMQSQITGLKELEKMQAQLMQMSIKQNFLLKVQEASLDTIEQQIDDLKEKSVSEPLLRFECPLTEMLDKIETLGAIMDEQVSVDEQVNVKPSNEQRIDYSQKILAKRTIGKRGSGDGEFENPFTMHVTDNGQLYVIDRGNKRVQVFNVENGTFLLHFGQTELTQPNGITANNDYCFVTDFIQNKIFRFRIGNYDSDILCQTKCISTSLKNPTGITVSDNVLYVADTMNNRVCVFDTNLNSVREFGRHDVRGLNHPIDVKLFFNEIFVLDFASPYCLHSFDELGRRLRSILTNGEGKQILNASSFLLDVDKNIIVPDCHSQTLKIFSAEGKLLHRIGKEAPDTEEVGTCFGVVLFKKNILLSCPGRFHCIKVF